MRRALKPIRWEGDSLQLVRLYPEPVRQMIGYELELLQRGIEPTDWKPMGSVGPSVNELRFHHEGEYRVLYVAKYQEAIYVLHVFQKKSRKTARTDLELAKLRWERLRRRRSEEA
ncbi:MAG: type II toxin-antitoxin system RelE/ParE family toxin [Acidobacteriota bacterium]